MNANEVDCLVHFLKLYPNVDTMFQIRNPMVKKFIVKDLEQSTSLAQYARLFTQLLNVDEMKEDTESTQEWFEKMNRRLDVSYIVDPKSSADIGKQKETIKKLLNKLKEVWE